MFVYLKKINIHELNTAYIVYMKFQNRTPTHMALTKHIDNNSPIQHSQ